LGSPFTLHTDACCARQDIEPTWGSILKILDYNTGLARFAGKGAWNDPDSKPCRLQSHKKPTQ
jgi:hypothetical protein